MLVIGVDQDIEDKLHNMESFAYAGLTTASNKRPKMTMESSMKSKNAIDNITCELTNSINAFQGFKTANNKPVKISDEALEKSKKLFQNINNCDSMLFQSQSKEASNSNTLKDSFQGFQTASNNLVKISDEALEKSRKIFQDTNNCDSVTSKANNKQASVLNSLKNIFQGFKTASNNPVRISDEALEKSTKIFQDINNCDSITPKHNSEQHSVSNTLKNTFQGFKTASNNPVKISDEALEKSKTIFKNINNPNDSDSMIFEAHSKEASVMNTLKNTFQSFKTASNNPVQISDEALEKCKTIFQDIIVNRGHHLLEKNSIENASFNKIETASNNTLSKEDLRKSKTLFEETENNLKTKIKQKLKDTYASMHTEPVKTNYINVHEYERNKEARKCFVDGNKTTKINITDFCNLLNTEVINNFNETMLTEDFINKSPSNKRSGSPILSCPRPKKIKTKLVHEPVLEKSSEPIDKTNRFAFNVNYKKHKQYKLLDLYEMDKATNAIQSYKEVNYDIHNISSLEFVGARNELSDSKWTLDNITILFLESVNKTIIPNGWVNNQIKLITLKLLSYEKRFPNSMQNVCSVSNVMEQLKYRYDRELYNVERPALRKILEKDEVPSRRMVLQVLSIYKNGSNVTDTSNSAVNIELLLTDGWYCVKATLDKLLTKLVCEGKITIGMKLITHGAELLHCEQGVAPWEDTSSVRLKISGNSTRRAHWAAKLGFHGNGAILSYLTTVKPEGGKISQLRVIATRVYPMLYVEKFDDGSTVTRSERLENLHQMKYEMERETMLEKIYEEVEKEFCMQASQCDSVDDDGKSLESGSQIYQLLKKSRDPAEFRAGLTYSQSKILQDYIDKRREVSLQDLQSKVQSLLKKRGLNVTRNVVAMLKIRVADVYKQNVTKGVITVWRPHESLLHLLREGTWLDIHNVVPTAVRYSEIQISAGKQSMFRKTSKVDDKMLNIAKTFERKCYLIQELTQNPYLTTDYNEIDTVGFVFDVEPSVEEFDCKKELFQNVFLADANQKIICINFWGGLKKFGFDSILETGQVVACINLQKRSGNTRKNIPQYRATEFTYFTKTPKIDVCRKACEDLSKQFLSLDRRKFVQDCIILRNNLVNIKYGNIENISPYRFNNSDYNQSKNKIFINGDPNLNLNGLDFNSTFQQSDATLSPKALLRKKEVNERIAKLRKYGEPPPSGPIHIVNKTRDAMKPYRSPLISKAESSNPAKSDHQVAVRPQTVSTSAVDDYGDENTSDNRCTSPVLPFKRRTVNPVRLNFSKQKNASKDDPFGEDFETSPPLSLD
ncbi:breast cancer type 2 susceptibility protein-like isoform X2 [Aricia agestis]|uniref:breast cancer type 2 susceptibility protein-like isoform X2 n=1 Tax=Aricia agestis TaxID=91739 RepID=UPI001C205C7C|nr:breast cancer type 2 susceptibility protein-like isoform X2 [Aricia agestis]